MKKMYLAILMALMIGQTACGMNEEKNPAEDTATFELTEANKEFLENICRTIDDFASPAEMDEVFWKDFLFFSYTGL